MSKTAEATTEEPTTTTTTKPEESTTTEESTTEEETAEEKAVNLAGDDKGKTETEKPEPRAPEKYNDFKMPDGVEADPQLLDGFTSLAKELDLPQEEAQRVIDFHSTIRESEGKAWVKQTQDWAAEIKADKDLGGDNFDANLGLVRQYVGKHGDEALAEMLNIGWGSNPGFFRLVLNFARAVGEDKLDDTPGNDGKKDTSEEAQLKRLYPTMFEEAS